MKGKIKNIIADMWIKEHTNVATIYCFIFLEQSHSNINPRKNIMTNPCLTADTAYVKYKVGYANNNDTVLIGLYFFKKRCKHSISIKETITINTSNLIFTVLNNEQMNRHPISPCKSSTVPNSIPTLSNLGVIK